MDSESLDLSAILDLKKAVSGAVGELRESETYTAQVISFDNDSTIWVHILGGAERTPAVATTVSVKQDEYVLVKIENGGCRIIGNLTSNSISASDAEDIFRIANNAQTLLEELQEANGSDYKRLKDSLVTLKNTINQSITEMSEAYSVTDAHFFYDDQGAHVVSDSEGLAGPHLLANMLGVLFMVAEYVNLSITRSSINFYDDSSMIPKDPKTGEVILDETTGHPAGITPIASYSKDGIVIGRPNSFHLNVTDSGIALYGDDGQTISAYISGKDFRIGTPDGLLVTQHGYSLDPDTYPTHWVDWGYPDPSKDGIPAGTSTYMWMRTVTCNQQGSFLFSSTPIRIEGVDGKDGKDGEARSIDHVTNMYLATSMANGVTKDTDGWTSTVQSTSSSKPYLWNYEILYDEAGTVISSTEPARIGNYSMDGKSISSITEYYLRSGSSSGVTVNTSGWSTDYVVPTATYPYIWNYEVIHYTDGSSSTVSPHMIGARGSDGLPGSNGSPGKDGSVLYAYYSDSTTDSVFRMAHWYDGGSHKLVAGDLILLDIQAWVQADESQSWTLRFADRSNRMSIMYNGGAVNTSDDRKWTMLTGMQVYLYYDGTNLNIIKCAQNYQSFNSSTGLTIGSGGYSLYKTRINASGVHILDKSDNVVSYFGATEVRMGLASSSHMSVTSDAITFYQDRNKYGSINFQTSPPGCMLRLGTRNEAIIYGGVPKDDDSDDRINSAAINLITRAQGNNSNDISRVNLVARTLDEANYARVSAISRSASENFVQFLLTREMYTNTYEFKYDRLILPDVRCMWGSAWRSITRTSAIMAMTSNGYANFEVTINIPDGYTFCSVYNITPNHSHYMKLTAWKWENGAVKATFWNSANKALTDCTLTTSVQVLRIA